MLRSYFNAYFDIFKKKLIIYNIENKNHKMFYKSPFLKVWGHH